MTDAHVAARAGYHPTNAHVILGVEMTAVTLTFEVYMVGSNRCGRGVDVWRCWVPCNE